MGNVPSVPTGEIQRVAEEVMKAFVPAYTKQFALALVKEAEAKRNTSPKQLFLKDPPVPSEPLMTGYLTKQGGVVKSWKKRYFVALNKANNWEIRYYMDEAAYKASPDKPRGTINLCYYRVEMTEEKPADTDKADAKVEEKPAAAAGEESKAGDGGDVPEITCKPWWSSDRRRVWHIKVDTPADAAKWKDVFETAAYKAAPPLSSDHAAASAFKAAYRETRWAIGEWGWYYYGTTEQEQLGLLISDRCERGCMAEVYAKVPAKMASMVRPQLQSALDTTVGAVVAAGWKSASASVAAVAPTLRAKVEESVGPIFDAKANIKTRMSDAISGAIIPVVGKAADLIVPHITALLLSYSIAANHCAITAFVKEMKKLDGSGSPEAFAKGIEQYRRECNYYWGPLYDAVQEIRNLYWKKPARKVAGISFSIPLESILELLGGVDLWQLSRDLEDGIRTLSARAAFTYGTLVEESPTSDKQQLLAKVVSLYIHDAKIMAYQEIHKVFSDILMTPINKDVTPTIQDALTPIKALVPDLLKDFVDIDGTLEDIIENAISSVVDASLIPAATTSLADLDSLLSLTPADLTVPNFAETLKSGISA
jgi:hypothetical protein